MTRARRRSTWRSPLRRWWPGRARSAALLAAGWAALGLSACGDTLQDQPATPSIMEPLMMQEFPIYWLGGTFHGLGITRVARDPSGAYEIQYGNCTLGGQNACTTPLRVVTSPDNSFLPGSAGAPRRILVRGLPVLSLEGGATLVVATGAVVVDLYARSTALARAAAATMVAINAPGDPGAPLPRPLPATGFAERPLSTQQPPGAPMGWASVLDPSRVR